MLKNANHCRPLRGRASSHGPATEIDRRGPSLPRTTSYPELRGESDDGRRAEMLAFLRPLDPDTRDEDCRDAIGCVGFGHAATPEVPEPTLRELCRRYLSEYRALRRRWGWR